MADFVKLKTQIMDALASIELPPELQAMVEQIPLDTIETAILQYGLPAALVLFFGRTVAIIILRAIGLYHPNQYRWWPRLIPWRKPFKAWMNVSMWVERVFLQGKQKTGGFAKELSMLTLMYTPKTLFLGRAYGWGVGLLQPIGVPVSRHIMIFAMSGAGKTTLLCTQVSLWKGSVSIIDPKSQITEVLARNDHREWVIFRPYSPDDSAQFNIFDTIKEMAELEGNSSVVKWATRVGEALIITDPSSKNKYFTDSARSFLVSLILHVLTFFDESYHHLSFCRELIIHGVRVVDDEGNLETTPEEARDLLYKIMLENTVLGDSIPGGASIYASASAETSGNLLSTLQEKTKWLDLPTVSNMMKKTTKPFSQLKTRDDVVFSFCAPVLSIKEELAPLVRLYTNTTAYVFEAIKEKKGQCLQVVDELPAQGHNSTIQMTLPVARSYGITFLGIAQDLEALKQAYPQTYKGFIGNSDVTIWMGTAHESNLEYLSKVLGTKSHVTKDRYSRKKTFRDEPVLTPDQVGRLLQPDNGSIIVTRAGRRALRLKNDPYYTALPVTKYDPDPEHGDSFLRSITRFFLNRKPKE